MITSENAKTNFAMGLCGDNLAWMLDDGVLTIAGEREMEYEDGYPWRSVSTLVTSVVIEDGVTSIGGSAFYGCTGLTSVVIPDGVISISWNAFRRCSGLANVVIPASVKNICFGAFGDCTGLTDVYYAGSKADWSKIMIDAGNDSLVNGTIHYGK